MDSQAYLNTIKLKLATSPSVSEAEILQEWGMDDKGFLRARLRLTNGDFVEVAEFFMIDQEKTRTVEYRYQWMDSMKHGLRKRWDNAPHHPELPNFPHHVHVKDEKRIEPGVLMNIVELIDLLEQELGGTL